jgi:FixJ family two-component response regulator
MSSEHPSVVAIVDDDNAVRVALVRVLRAANLHAVGYASGQAFLDALAQGTPDCVLLDLWMPGLTGLEVQQALRASHCDCPVIIITGSEDPDIRRRCIEAGAAGFLRKPLDPAALVDVILYSIERRRVVA